MLTREQCSERLLNSVMRKLTEKQIQKVFKPIYDDCYESINHEYVDCFLAEDLDLNSELFETIVNRLVELGLI